MFLTDWHLPSDIDQDIVWYCPTVHNRLVLSCPLSVSPVVEAKTLPWKVTERQVCDLCYRIPLRAHADSRSYDINVRGLESFYHRLRDIFHPSKLDSVREFYLQWKNHSQICA